MNIYWILVIIIACILLFLIAKDLSSYENLIEMYDKLDDKGKEKINQLLDYFEQVDHEKELRYQARIEWIAKIISSNRWLWTNAMQIFYHLLTEEQKTLWKQTMVKKVPNHNNLIEGEQFKDDNSNPPPKA